MYFITLSFQLRTQISVTSRQQSAKCVGAQPPQILTLEYFVRLAHLFVFLTES